MRRAGCIRVAITSRGDRIGHLTPEQFRRGVGASDRMFLAEAVRQFNEWKEKIGEPERAELEVASK